MTDIASSDIKVIDGTGLECIECDQEPRIAQRTMLFCLPCARKGPDVIYRISCALLQLLEEESCWAAGVADALFGGPDAPVGNTPWASGGAEREADPVLPTGLLQVEPDPLGTRWVTSKGKNFGDCEECGAPGPELLGVTYGGDGVAPSIEFTCCRSCAVRLTHDAAALRLAVMEMDATEGVRAERASHDAQREELGFVPIIWLPTTGDLA